MEEKYMQVSFSKIMELVLNEERAKIRKFYMDTLGKPTADYMDTYCPTESEIMKIFS